MLSHHVHTQQARSCAGVQRHQKQQQQSTIRASRIAAKATLLAERDAVASIRAAVEPLGGFFPPPLTDDPAALLQQNVPFLTKAAGALPVQPRSLSHALYNYGSYTSKYVSVRVDNVHIKLGSWEHAVESLADAEERRKPYWCSLIEAVQHPHWWPEQGHVPTYDQVIFGRGNASIGLHFDKDNACAGGSRRPVNTYLAICSGAKLTLLLPPDQTLLPAGGDSALLLQPSQQLLDDVKAAGGYFFLMEDDGQLVEGSTNGFSGTGLYMPTGWHHWLVGLTDWHVVYGGSFYPEQQPWLQQ
ncbi:hypothetical protein OEZ85_006442 [Tetradesmus obliquus]|uniref:Cupin-like domain-containing protein n=1 Tax=Tetradesmus obliquus TaxID=3088 RepID=A0ABY8TWY4_TETOB|nr:hypothetical protein OEZ85_006442 [Tetradesmus obliquus]